eukprot:3957064-Karenia_brevis.AAC.1
MKGESWGAGLDTEDAEFIAQEIKKAEEDMAIQECDKKDAEDDQEMFDQSAQGRGVGSNDPWS